MRKYNKQLRPLTPLLSDGSLSWFGVKSFRGVMALSGVKSLRGVNFTRGLFAALVLSLCSAPSQAQNFDFEYLLPKAREYTVFINAKVAISLGSETHETKSRGLGTVLTSDGLVMFNSSLVEFGGFYGGGANSDVLSIRVSTVNGKEFEAEWLGSDRYSGIGFCKVRKTDSWKSGHIKFQKQSAFKIGDWMALFFPLPEHVNPNLAADIGMVSALLEKPERFPLLVGFSEGQLFSPLYDTTGAAVGVLGRAASPSSRGSMFDPLGSGGRYPLLGIFTVDRIEKLIENPPERGAEKRGWLGVSYQALSADLAEYWGLETDGGVIINEVVRNSPAMLAGAKVGDIITSINSEPVNVEKEENLMMFGRAIAELGPNAEAKLSVLRKTGDRFVEIELKVRLAPAPLSAGEADTYKNSEFDFRVRDLVFNDFITYNLDQETFAGVWVTEVGSGGWTELGGLEPGDIIQLINGKEITDADNVESSMEQIVSGRSSEVVFFVWRNYRTLFVNIKPDWRGSSP